MRSRLKNFFLKSLGCASSLVGVYAAWVVVHLWFHRPGPGAETYGLEVIISPVFLALAVFYYAYCRIQVQKSEDQDWRQKFDVPRQVEGRIDEEASQDEMG